MKTASKKVLQPAVLIVIAIVLGVVRNDPLRKLSNEVTDLSGEDAGKLDWDATSTAAIANSSDDLVTTTQSEADDQVGISTVMVELKHFGTKNFTFLEPDHIPISDYMDENVDLELLFTEEMNADWDYGGNPAENIVLQIEDYDDEGNSQSYFLHSTPHSENYTNENSTTEVTPPSKDVSSRVSGFFRDVLQRLGVYKYIVGQQQTLQQQPPQALVVPSTTTTTKIPHRFRPHFINTPKGLRNLPAHFSDQLTSLDPGTSTTPGFSSTTLGLPSSSTNRPSSSTSPRPSKSSIGNLFNQFKQRIKAIYPGTVWCGDGNQAKSENDIGFFYLTDTCCRAHDLCPVAIASGEQFNRLRNNGYFTRSHCDCDKQFYNCLKNANTLVSNQIGYTYFNLLKPQCFRHEHPKVACSKKSKGRCLTYVVDEKKDKLWQWFDNLIY